MMKNQQQANNNNLSDPSISNDPRAQVEDLPISVEQEEQVKGGAEKNRKYQWIEVTSITSNRGNSAQDDKLTGSAISLEIK
jgi:hypothetical protein